jgi:uncharacterized peroxidase-related enzyme
MTTYKMQQLKPVETGAAKSPAKDVMEGAQKNMGMVPNMYRTMANLPALLGAYEHGYNLFREMSGFSPVEQEVVLITISRENGCDYCVAAHSFIADNMSKVPEAVTDALRAGETPPDDKLAALSKFTRVMVETRGWPDKVDAKAFLDAGYEEMHMLGVVLALSVKTISNYSNHLFGTELDDAFASRRWDG